MSDNKWLRLLAYVTGLGDQEMLLQNEYFAAEDGIRRACLPRLRLGAGERQTFAEIGKRLGSWRCSASVRTFVMVITAFAFLLLNNDLHQFRRIVCPFV